MKLKILGKSWTIGSEPEKIETVTVKKGISDTLGGFLDFRNPLSGEKQISSKLVQSYYEWVYVNVSTLAETVASIEFELHQFKMTNGQIELEPIDEHELLDLLDKFNDTTTKTDAIYNTEAHLDLAGDAFWLLDEVSGNKPESMRVLQPDNVELELQVDQTKGVLVKAYKYKAIVDGKQVERTYKPEEVIHIKVPNPANPYRGKSAVEALATTIDTDNYAQEALKNLFRNGMVGDFFLSTEKRATPEQLKNLAAQFRAAYTGVKNFWKVPILYGGIKPEKLMSTGRELQLIELEQWFRNKIMSAFKNTRASLGIDDEVNRATAEASLINWKRSVIAPKMARICNALNEYLVPRYGDNLLLGFKDPVPEDREGEVKEATDLFNAKIITKNEARQIIGYEEVEGGDDFEVIVNPLAPNFQDDVKRLVPSLKYINIGRAFRKYEVYSKAKEFKELKAQALPLAKKIVRGKKKEEVREHGHFTNDQVWDYWEKQMTIVEYVEKIFRNIAEQFSDHIVREGLTNIDDPARRNQGDLVDKDELVEYAINKFMPVMSEVVALSGQHANRLIGIDEPYLPTKAINTKDALREQILLFASSMVDTDVDIMVELLATGLDEGLSIPQIRKAITDKFDTFTKVEAERVTRTEVLKASNLGAQDAFEQSGVVEGKQWLTAQDDRTDEDCAEMDGVIVELDSDYDDTIISKLGDKGAKLLSYSSVEYPPLHPNCRCTLLPVIVGQEDFDIRSFKTFQELKDRIKQAEEKADKRTKGYKELKEKYAQVQHDLEQLQSYTTELEKLADES